MESLSCGSGVLSWMEDRDKGCLWGFSAGMARTAAFDDMTWKTRHRVIQELTASTSKSTGATNRACFLDPPCTMFYKHQSCSVFNGTYLPLWLGVLLVGNWRKLIDVSAPIDRCTVSNTMFVESIVIFPLTFYDSYLLYMTHHHAFS